MVSNGPGTRRLVIGTAGHIDHGKSTLVKALTGTDPDRLPEEKERGITIDLGFAFVHLPDGTQLMFVDVPGHERFVKNMLAGAAGVDAALLVIAADESVMPQTREHLDILSLLRIPRGLIALTKADAADADAIALSEMEARELCEGTFLQGAPILAVDSISRRGLPALVSALQDLARDARPRDARGVFRLPVDRAFAIKGFGTVVTGTASGQPIREGSTITIYPAGRDSRVRSIEVAGEAADATSAGARTALNLPDVPLSDVRRGDVVALPGALPRTTGFYARLEVLAGSPVRIKDRDRLRLHLGSAELFARVRILDRGAVALAPGSAALCFLALESATVAAWRDRFVVRRYSPILTIGGGEILLPCDLPGLRRDDAARAALLSALARPDLGEAARSLVTAARLAGATAQEIGRLLGHPDDAIAEALREAVGTSVQVTDTGRYVASEALESAAFPLKEAVATHHRAAPLQPGASREHLRKTLYPHAPADVFRLILARAEAEGAIVQDRDTVRLPEFTPRSAGADTADMERIAAAYLDAGVNPPTRDEAVKTLAIPPPRFEALTAAMVRDGVLRRTGGSLLFHGQVLDDVAARVRALLPARPTLTVPEFKDLVGTSRKYAIPMLEYLDSRHVTERQGDSRRILPLPTPRRAT